MLYEGQSRSNQSGNHNQSILLFKKERQMSVLMIQVWMVLSETGLIVI